MRLAARAASHPGAAFNREDEAPPIFISYSRQDGRSFAEDLQARLVDAGLTAWRDLKSVEGGEDIRAQVLQAIETSRHLVLILTPCALASAWVKREWTHARASGVKISPVFAAPGMKKSELPFAWMRRVDVYDTSEPERWERLIAVLKGPGETRRVPDMAGPLPPSFIPRDVEFQALKQAVLSGESAGPVALTTALQGACGYGKTTPANALCRDDDVRAEFSDGILRVEVGKERSEVLSLVVDLIEKLDPGGRRPGFENPDVAAEHLAEVIGEARLLLVIDDVWRESQLRPFLRGGPNCVRLVTTRRRDTLPPKAVAVDVDEMRAAEALALLSWDLGDDIDASVASALAELAGRLERWPQMMEISNGCLRGRVADGEPLAKALDRFRSRLDKRGPTAFDPADEAERNRAIGVCVAAGVEDMSPADFARFEELAILPEDEAVPIDAIEDLWARTGDLDEDETDDLLRQLRNASLLQDLDLGRRRLRLHDNMVWLLRERLGDARLAETHRAMADALHARAAGGWGKLPTEDYAFRFLLFHLRGAGDYEAADALLLDCDWMRAKLLARGIDELLAAYASPWRSEAISIVSRAIAASAKALGRRPAELPRQMNVRLSNIALHDVRRIVYASALDSGCWPLANRADLCSARAEVIGSFQHENCIRSLALSPEGARFDAASHDGAVSIWDAKTETKTQFLRGHEGRVLSAAFSADGACVVTASWDGTARIWDASNGTEMRVIRGHKHWVSSAAFSPDGCRVVTASRDGTSRVWNASTGLEICRLCVQTGFVPSAYLPSCNERLSKDQNGKLVQILDLPVSDGDRDIQWCGDWFQGVQFSPNGAHVIATSRDSVARVWDASTGIEICSLRGAGGRAECAAFSTDGAFVATASWDGTVRLWDAASGAEIRAFHGHEGWVTGAVLSADGSLLVTASWDGTARIWDATSGIEVTGWTLDDGIGALAFQHDLVALGDARGRVHIYDIGDLDRRRPG